jgi:hypothetical protein
MLEWHLDSRPRAKTSVIARAPVEKRGPHCRVVDHLASSGTHALIEPA